jgi:hypothetical protein
MSEWVRTRRGRNGPHMRGFLPLPLLLPKLIVIIYLVVYVCY